MLLSACAPERTLPPVHAGDEPPAAGGEGVASDPVRVDYAAILERCEGTRDDLQAEVDAARERERNLAIAAAAVYAAGELADGNDDSDIPTDGMGGQPPCPSDRSQQTPCVQPVPSAGRGEGSPVRESTDEVHADARRTLDAINRSIEAADEFLFSRPDVDAWSDEERARWAELRDTLARQCRADAQ